MYSRSQHPGGVNVALGDGSVRFIRQDINPAIWQGMGTRSGREVVQLD
jgi:prepilin-type processing-associated H-X9-DG protein